MEKASIEDISKERDALTSKIIDLLSEFSNKYQVRLDVNMETVEIKEMSTGRVRGYGYKANIKMIL